MALLAKKSQRRTFNDVLAILGGQRFDVATGAGGCKAGPERHPGAEVRLCGRDCSCPDGTVEIVTRPGWLLNGEISRLVDRGYQKFLQDEQDGDSGVGGPSARAPRVHRRAEAGDRCDEPV